jgi:hypothetical protein
LVFLTNNFDLPALTIARLYKSRWRVELFFKWIKQNLRIKHFFGTSDNAVKTQVWIAICVYVLVAIVRKELGLELSLSQILQVLSVNVFEQVPLAELVAKTASQNEDLADSRNQLVFNGAKGSVILEIGHLFRNGDHGFLHHILCFGPV